MNPTAINAPISPSPRSPLLSHFLTPSPLRLSKTQSPARRRYRASFPRCAATSSEQPPVSNKRELTGLQPIVEKMTPPVRLATSAVVLAASLATGYGLGLRLAGSRNIALGGAAVAGAAGGAVVYALNSAVPEVAAIGLHNYVAEFEDPASVTKEDIEKIASRYGVSKGDEAFHAEICGSIFEKVVREAISSGVDGYDAETRKSVRKAAHGLRLSRETAMSIASKAVRRVFTNYIRRARSAENRTESAKELKKMIAFNTLVVTEMLADIKGESSDKEPEEPVQEKEEDGEDEEWGSLESLRKTRPDKELAEKMGKPGQTEITLRDDLPDRDRIDLYKTYLLYCLTGEVTRIPFGAQITTKRDDSEYLLLNQLGGILGLTSKEIVNIHVGLAEQAFRQQAEVILADGQLTKARVEQLDELQKQVGLPQPQAEKVIKNITTTKMANAIETAVNQGRLNIKQIRELKEANVSLDSMIAVSLREKLFKKTVNEIFSSGTGEFDETEVYETIPSDLSIDVEKAKGVVHDLAGSRLSNSLIQAVALLRQRNAKGVVSSLNDLLACDKAVPAEPLSWEVSEELSDLYSIYSKTDPKPAPEKVSRLQYLLGIDDSTATALREMEDGAFSSAAEEGNFVF
ncbi:hypothetical protein Bca52824_006769 [Brassica carinata]|uniref:Protein TIC110, chloroplastic n=1 Tax=Brassica carinata TaxID=52824 RepID=A0A8X7W6K7_BRACI|nr:hypothetical protein Bca52824_006769 [Brassica carinata]